MNSFIRQYFDITENRLENSINILMFFIMVLIGSDRISVDVAGMTIRFVQLLLLVVFLLMFFTKRFKLVNLMLFVPFLISNIISTLFSYVLINSLAYTIWTLFNYLLVYCLFYSWCHNKDRQWIVKFWWGTFWVQGIYIIVQYIIGRFSINDPFFKMQVHLGIYRPAIWFYEPSYLATYFIVYFSLAFYIYINIGGKYNFINLIFSYFCLLIISSSTGYLGIGLVAAILIGYVVMKRMKIKLKRIFTSVICMSAVFFICYLSYPKMYDFFVGRMLPTPPTPPSAGQTHTGKSSIEQASGGRMEGWKETYEVFTEHPIVGIGPNAYGIYTGKGRDSQPSNVTLEVAASLGIIGLITLSVFVFGVIFRALKNIDDTNKVYSSAIIFAFIIFCIVLQANQNYLRLYMWMHMGIISGCCIKRNTE